MSLYAIGDLHLNFMVDRNMDQYGSVWKHHEKRLEKNWRRYITQQDTVVVTGDHTMGRKMAECTADLDFIASLPGRKILLRGNHDMFWKSKKTPVLNEIYEGRLQFLQNNFYSYGEYALVGTKGYCFEGKDSYEHFLTIRKRELERLELSFEQAKEAGALRRLLLSISGKYGLLSWKSRTAISDGERTVVITQQTGNGLFHIKYLPSNSKHGSDGMAISLTERRCGNNHSTGWKWSSSCQTPPFFGFIDLR